MLFFEFQKLALKKLIDPLGHTRMTGISIQQADVRWVPSKRFKNIVLKPYQRIIKILKIRFWTIAFRLAV